MSKAKRQIEILWGYLHEQRYFVYPETLETLDAEQQVLSSDLVNFLSYRGDTTFIALRQNGGWLVCSSQSPSHINPFFLPPDKRHVIDKSVAYMVFPILKRHNQNILFNEPEQFRLI